MKYAVKVSEESCYGNGLTVSRQCTLEVSRLRYVVPRELNGGQENISDITRKIIMHKK